MAAELTDMWKITKAWSDAGLIPPETRRIIIDITYDDAVRVYTESFADTRMFQLDLTDVLRRARILTIKDAT